MYVHLPINRYSNSHLLDKLDALKRLIECLHIPNNLSKLELTCYMLYRLYCKSDELLEEANGFD